jgi:hypothetical protein
MGLFFAPDGSLLTKTKSLGCHFAMIKQVMGGMS